jgi:F-type H+-transporting ATPase subunit delta
MHNLRISNRYAEALIKEAEELHALKEVGNDLHAIRNTIKKSEELRSLLRSPIIKSDKKRRMFEAAFGKSVHPLTLRFLFFLSEKERESDLPGIIEAFFRLQEETMGIVRVDVKTAAEFSDRQMSQLKSWLEEYLKKQVHIDVQLDSQLMGGFVARIGDTMFDGSIKHQLELLHKRFVEIPVG